MEKQSRKDTGLDNRLKQVYVTSKDTFVRLTYSRFWLEI